MKLGPLSDIASELGVTDIAVTCDGTVWVDRGQGMRPYALRVPFANPQAIRDFAVRLCSQLGRRLDDACPIADASTVEGVRVHAVIAPLVPQARPSAYDCRMRLRPIWNPWRKMACFQANGCLCWKDLWNARPACS